MSHELDKPANTATANDGDVFSVNVSMIKTAYTLEFGVEPTENPRDFEECLEVFCTSKLIVNARKGPTLLFAEVRIATIVLEHSKCYMTTDKHVRIFFY